MVLVEGNGLICRASAGKIAPERGARLDPKSGFSGACLRSGEMVRCDDSEKDARVNAQTCRRLGTRSMVAVPLSASNAVLGMLEVFSTDAYGFNDSDVRSLGLLAELILDAMRPEEETRLAEISQQVIKDAPEAAAKAESAVVLLQKIEGEKAVVEKPEAKASEAAKAEIEKPEIAKPEAEAPQSPASELKPEIRTFPDRAQAASGSSSSSAKHLSRLVFFSEYEQAETSRPGLKVVVLLVILAIALGTGLAYQFRHRNPATHSSVILPEHCDDRRGNGCSEKFTRRSYPERPDEDRFVGRAVRTRIRAAFGYRSAALVFARFEHGGDRSGGRGAV